MFLQTLHLRQFRNYTDQTLDFSAPKTILLGDNAQGKSNVLEALELMATLRSHRVTRDRDLVLERATEGQIRATLQRATGNVEIAMTLRTNGRRSISLNQEKLRRHLDVLGQMNAVQFSSLDLELVRGGPDERRQWLDGLLIQLEPVYANILEQYQQVLRQRNALLKNQAAPEEEESDTVPVLSDNLSTELGLWDAQLVATGVRVIRRRSRVLQRLLPLAQAWHHQISGSTEWIHLNYRPNVPIDTDVPEVIQSQFLDQLQQWSGAEQQRGTTLVGPHRDEIELTINQTPARQYGSQGQQRTLVLALKLAELQLIEEIIGEPPLLLLDDVLAELDLKRQNQLLSVIGDRVQTIITTTHLGAFDSSWLSRSQILRVESGQIFPTAVESPFANFPVNPPISFQPQID
jgi:DNA replication and repair protein RecF